MPSATLPTITPVSSMTEELGTLVRTLQAHSPDAAGRLLNAVSSSVAFEALVRLSIAFPTASHSRTVELPRQSFSANAAAFDLLRLVGMDRCSVQRTLRTQFYKRRHWKIVE